MAGIVAASIETTLGLGDMSDMDDDEEEDDSEKQ